MLSTVARPIRRPGNLPAEATSFIGRRRELAELRTKLAAARLVTLVGPGGVGKTRLAIRGATELARAFPRGAWLVELADVRDPSLVQNAILAALARPEGFEHAPPIIVAQGEELVAGRCSGSRPHSGATV